MVVGGVGRSGTSLLGNLLGTWSDALYLPVEVRLARLAGPGAEAAARRRSLARELAAQLDRGEIGPSSLGEIHAVKGFRGQIFGDAFLAALGEGPSAAAVLRAFVHAMCAAREDGAAAQIAVVESVGGEHLFDELVTDGADVRGVHMIRPLVDVYASAKAKYLRTYYPALRHPENLLRQIVVEWRRSVARAALHAAGPAGARALVVEFDEARRCSEAFRARLLEFVLPGEAEGRGGLRARLDDVAAGEDPLQGRFVVAQNRSPLPAGRDRYGHLAGWERELCRLYDRWFSETRARCGLAPSPESVAAGTRAGNAWLSLTGLVLKAAVVGPLLDRQALHARHGLTLRRRAVETVLETARWMRGPV